MFERVPACRFAVFRTFIALANLFYFIPRQNRVVDYYIHSWFHQPTLDWIPTISVHAGFIFMGLQYLVGMLLLFGVAARLSAGFLSLCGLYVLLLDKIHFSHNGELHVIFLFILALSNNKLSLIDLFREKKRTSYEMEAWPEYLIRFQLFVVFFYTALDKMFSPFWGSTGSFLVYELGNQTVFRLDAPTTWFYAVVGLIVSAAPGMISILVIGVEFFLAAAFLFRRLWNWAVRVSLLFIIVIELLISPGLFTWDLLAALVLFLPAGIKRYGLVYVILLMTRWDLYGHYLEFPRSVCFVLVVGIFFFLHVSKQPIISTHD